MEYCRQAANKQDAARKHLIIFVRPRKEQGRQPEIPLKSPSQGRDWDMRVDTGKHLRLPP